MLEEYNDILTVKDVQTILKIGKNSALDLIHEGDIEAFMIKGRWRILKSDLLSYIRHIK
ncbi:MAG: helix-turn-helix domain-containing protein [Clostridia bacterium]|nr:helix-turn-helix domain-containing protein [Clostridia bacterium]